MFHLLNCTLHSAANNNDSQGKASEQGKEVMNTRKCTVNWISLIKYSLLIGYASSVHAEQNLAAYAHLSTPYSKDIAAVDPISSSQFSKKVKARKNRLSVNLNRGQIDQKKVGSLIYKALDNPDKIRSQVAGSAALLGLDYLGVGGTVKEGINFIKEKTRYHFGKCSNVRLGTKRLKAQSCVSKRSSIELDSNYNLDAVQLNFSWSL